MPRRDAEFDPDRRLAAAHELGHWYGFRCGGVDCTTPIIRGYGESATGFVITRDNGLTTPEEIRAHLIGAYAGQIAGRLWAAQPGETARQTNRQCAIDNRIARHMLRLPAAHRISRAAMYRLARILVRRHWHRITAHVPKLARDGRIRL